MAHAHHRIDDFFTQGHQFKLASEAYNEAVLRLRARWYAASISQSYQVAHRAAAGLLFARGAKIFTEKEVRYGFSAQFVAAGLAPQSLLDDYDRLAVLRHQADFEFDHDATKEEAEEALAAAQRFWDAAKALAAPTAPS